MTGETGMKCDMNKDDAIAKLELLIKEGEREFLLLRTISKA